MKIESPLYALNSLAQTQKALDRALQQLSSGQRINSASDDPAGLSIANGLESQMRGVQQGILNINESFGFLATAEGSIATQVQITQRMRELAVQAATGTLSKTDRGYLNTEFQQLLDEYNRIAEQTNFNGTKLLDGTFSTSNIQVGAKAQETIPINLGSTLSGIIFPTNTFQSTTTTSTTNAGTFNAQVTKSVDGNAESISAGDFNGDGKQDLLIANDADSTVSVLLGNGDGTFSVGQTVTPGTGFGNSVGSTIGDFNGDGKLDFALTDVNQSDVLVFTGHGDGTFTQSQTIPSGVNVWWETGNTIINADFNGDGKKDLAEIDYTDGVVSVFKGNGDGTFAARSTYAVSGSGTYIAAADLNHDGKLDIITTDQVNNKVDVLIGNGDGSFKAKVAYAAGTTTYGVVVGDINGDGNSDVIAANNGTNTVSVLLGNGDGTLKAQTTLTVGNAPAGVQLLDINGDGKLDIVTADNTDNTLSVLIGNGDGSFKARVTYSTGAASGPTNLVLVDMNGDSYPDIGVLDETSHKIGSLLNAATTTTTTTTTGQNIPFDISTQTDASNILSVLDSGLTNLNAERSSIGAYQSRLQSALNVNSIAYQNISSARSQVMDTDVASVTSELVKQQILEQAGVAVLGQANLQNQLLLKLLQF